MSGLFLWLLLAHPPRDVNLTLPLTYARAAPTRTFKITFYCSCKKCCGRHSPQKGGSGNTSLGHSPVPFRTGATGDPALLGRWVEFPDLGAPVYLSDTGATCTTKKGKGAKRKGAVHPCVARDQVDIFIGGPEMHRHALRMGVMWWEGRVR